LGSNPTPLRGKTKANVNCKYMGDSISKLQIQVAT
jgi:hypothetical protein